MRIQTYCDYLCDICNNTMHDLNSHHITGFIKVKGKNKLLKVSKGTR